MSFRIRYYRYVVDPDSGRKRVGIAKLQEISYKTFLYRVKHLDITGDELIRHIWKYLQDHFGHVDVDDGKIKINNTQDFKNFMISQNFFLIEGEE